MSCNEFELIVLELARKSLMDASTDTLAMAHAASCTCCASRLTAERFLLAGARAVVSEIATQEAPARVEAMLLAAFRQQAPAATADIPSEITSNRSSYWMPATIAASILILISSLAVFWSYSKSLPEVDEQLKGLLVPVELPKPQLVTIGMDEQVALPEKSRFSTRPRPRTVGRRTARAEFVTEFYPLVEGEELDSSKVSHVVRVELPASALSAAGFTVSPEMSTVPVQADVALGYDGLARAVRFVR